MSTSTATPLADETHILHYHNENNVPTHMVMFDIYKFDGLVGIRYWIWDEESNKTQRWSLFTGDPSELSCGVHDALLGVYAMYPNYSDEGKMMFMNQGRRFWKQLVSSGWKVFVSKRTVVSHRS